MDLFIYSNIKNSHRYWDSPDQSFQNLISDNLCNCDNVAIISNSCLLIIKDENTSALVKSYCSKYEKSSKCNTREINDIFSKLGDGGYMFLIDASSTDDYERVSVIDFLRNCRSGLDANSACEFIKNELSEFEECKRKYELFAFGFDGIKTIVGEKDKSKRVCRFCGEARKDKFKDVAHAIPESLGNELLICNEECDVCNHQLRDVEDNFTHLMDVRRALYGIKRKESGIPNVNGQNFVIKDGGHGDPILYVMENAAKKDCYNPDEISVRLNHKYITTNENIYKALCKMVINLIPSKYLQYFSETIEWLKSGGKFHPGILPSCHSAILPSGIFYAQPELNIYVKKEINGEMPFCFALLKTCDILYRYIIPLASPDKGRFKKDENLVGFWNQFSSNIELEWSCQDTNDWWDSAPYVEFSIVGKASNIIILPSNDSVFDVCREKKSANEELHYSEFKEENINVSFNKLIVECYVKHPIPQHKLRDVTVERTNIIFVVYKFDRYLSVKYKMVAMSSDKKNKYFGCKFDANVSSKDFEQQVLFDEYHINVDFLMCVWDTVITEAARQIKNKMKYTPIRNINVLKDSDSSDKRFIRESIVRFVLENNQVINIPWKCMYEDMPYKKSVDLITNVNPHLYINFGM